MAKCRFLSLKTDMVPPSPEISVLVGSAAIQTLILGEVAQNCKITARELYAPDGMLLKLGEIFKRPKLAKTFEKIANEGADVFYNGSMTDIIVNDIREAGGVLSRADLNSYNVTIEQPIIAKIKGYTVLSTPAPSSGALMTLALKIMERFNWKPSDLRKRPANVYHKMIEAMKFAYAPATFLGDPRFNNHTHEVEEYMIADSTADEMAKKVDDKSHDVKYYEPYSTLFSEEKTGTSHMSILDQDGNAVSVTSSINAYFGSKLRSRDLGFIYNNELADFSEYWPTIYNLTSDKKVPYKRPVSKSMPSIWLAPEKDTKGDKRDTIIEDNDSDESADVADVEDERLNNDEQLEVEENYETGKSFMKKKAKNHKQKIKKIKQQRQQKKNKKKITKGRENGRGNQPGKQTKSQMNRLQNRRVDAVFGAAGGFFIPSCVTMTIANWLFFKDNIKTAITRPRLHCQLFPPTVVYEPTLPPQIVPKIEAYGHKYVTNSTYDVSGQLHAIMGVVQAIVRTDNGTIAAECDYRKGGAPDGF